jgi:hypothetical protein
MGEPPRQPPLYSWMVITLLLVLAALTVVLILVAVGVPLRIVPWS